MAFPGAFLTAACAAASEVPMLPRLEVPDGAVLLYEQVAPQDMDRSADWRFYLRSDGCWFQARNQALVLSEAADLGKDDPALFWNVPFGDQPQACLSKEELDQVLRAVDGAGFQDLDPYYPLPSGVRVSHPAVARWTVRDGSDVQTVVVEQPDLWKAKEAAGKQWWAARKGLAGVQDALNAAVGAALRRGQTPQPEVP
jgi:hypothetical protein